MAVNALANDFEALSVVQFWWVLALFAMLLWHVSKVTR